jgi:transcriptional regulator with XRE-family HTH domain
MDFIQAKMARAALSLTVRQVAESVEIMPNTVTRIESGKNAMGSMLNKLKEFYESKGIEFQVDGWIRLKRKP